MPSRSRGIPRCDSDSLAEAQAAPPAKRSAVFKTGETHDGREVFRTTPFNGLVMVSLIERYLSASVPVSCQEQKDIVCGHSSVGLAHKNPLTTIRTLERAGAVHRTIAGRDSDLIPRTRDILLVLDDGTVVWPKAAQEAEAPKPAAKSKHRPETTPPSAAALAFLAAMNEAFGAIPFTGSQACVASPANASTVYDWLRSLTHDGKLVIASGKKGDRRNPAHYKIVEVVGKEEVHAPAPLLAVRSKVEILAELADGEAELERLRERGRKLGLLHRPRELANADVERIRAELVAAERALADVDAQIAAIGGVPDCGRIEDLERRIEALRPVSENYDALVSVLVRPS